MPQSQWSTLVLIALMVVAFYFLILRPQKKRQQAAQKTMNEVQPGTRVLLGSGLFGTVVAVGDKQVILEISPGVELTVLKPAIARIVTDADEDTFVDADDEYDDELTAEPEFTEPHTVTEPRTVIESPPLSDVDNDRKTS